MTPSAAPRLIQLVLDSLTSPQSKRAYGIALQDFLGWFRTHQPPEGFTKGTVQSYRAYLLEKGLSGSTVNQRLSAVRKLAQEAADNQLMDAQVAGAISRVPGVKKLGTRSGNWLGLHQAEEMLQLPNPATLRGKRDRALLAVLLGCGLRREECSNLTAEHIQQRDGRWVIVDLLGKGMRIRSVPMPSWCKAAIDEYSETMALPEATDTPYRLPEATQSPYPEAAEEFIPKQRTELASRSDLAFPEAAILKSLPLPPDPEATSDGLDRSDSDAHEPEATIRIVHPEATRPHPPKRLFVSISKSDRITGDSMSPQAVFNVVRKYASRIGLPNIAPHDLRRSFAKLAHKGKSPLEQIQLSLGHASITTTERYLGVKQDLTDAPCDHLGIRMNYESSQIPPNRNPKRNSDL